MSATPQQKTGGLALAALTLAILATLALLGGFAMAYHAVTTHLPDARTLAAIGMMLFGGGVLDLAALVLAVLALRGGANHRIATLAGALAAIGLVIALAVLVLGLTHRH